jgi:hypothetical protein
MLGFGPIASSAIGAIVKRSPAAQVVATIGRPNASVNTLTIKVTAAGGGNPFLGFGPIAAGPIGASPQKIAGAAGFSYAVVKRPNAAVQGQQGAIGPVTTTISASPARPNTVARMYLVVRGTATASRARPTAIVQARRGARGTVTASRARPNAVVQARYYAGAQITGSNSRPNVGVIAAVRPIGAISQPNARPKVTSFLSAGSVTKIGESTPTSTYNSASGTNNRNRILVGRFRTPVGQPSKISGLGISGIPNVIGNFRAVIYRANGAAIGSIANGPGTLLQASGDEMIMGSLGFVIRTNFTFPVNTMLDPNTDYWIGVHLDFAYNTMTNQNGWNPSHTKPSTAHSPAFFSAASTFASGAPANWPGSPITEVDIAPSGGNESITLSFDAVQAGPPFGVIMANPVRPNAVSTAVRGARATTTASMARPGVSASSTSTPYRGSATATMARPVAFVYTDYRRVGAVSATTVRPNAVVRCYRPNMGTVDITTPRPNPAIVAVRPNSATAAASNVRPNVTAYAGRGARGSFTQINLRPNPVITAAQSARRTSFSGGMAETIVIKRALTQSETEKMEGYLAWKYHQQARLHPSHPYKYSPPTFFEPVRSLILAVTQRKATAALVGNRRQAITTQNARPSFTASGRHGIAASLAAPLLRPAPIMRANEGARSRIDAFPAAPTMLVNATYNRAGILAATVAKPVVSMVADTRYRTQVVATNIRPVPTMVGRYIDPRYATTSATIARPTMAAQTKHIIPLYATAGATIGSPTAAVYVGDRYYNQTELYLRNQTQVNGSYAHVDTSKNPKTIPVNAASSAVTIVQGTPYGEAGGRSSRIGDSVVGQLQINGAPAFNAGTGDFAVEMWLSPLGSAYATPKNASALFDGGFRIGLLQSGNIFCSLINGGNEIANSKAWNIVAGVPKFTHVAICRANGTIRAFVNGQIVATQTNTNPVHLTGSDAGVAYLYNAPGVAGTNLQYALIDDVRITMAGRYVSPFNPFTEAPVGDNARTGQVVAIAPKQTALITANYTAGVTSGQIMASMGRPNAVANGTHSAAIRSGTISASQTRPNGLVQARRGARGTVTASQARPNAVFAGSYASATRSGTITASNVRPNAVFAGSYSAAIRSGTVTASNVRPIAALAGTYAAAGRSGYIVASNTRPMNSAAAAHGPGSNTAATIPAPKPVIYGNIPTTASPWSPTNLTTAPIGWWDAQDAASIFVTGTAVTAWNNKGSVGGQMVQGTAARRPTLTTGPDGLPAITCTSATPTRLEQVAFPAQAGALCAFVISKVATITDGVAHSVFTQGSGNSRVNFMCSISATNALQVGQVTTDTTFGPYPVEQRALASWFKGPPGTLQPVAGETNANISGINRVLTGSVVAGAYVGFQAQRRGINADIHEIVYLDYWPTPDDKDRIEGYLAWKWGIQSNLPIDHEYYNAAPTTAVNPHPVGYRTDVANAGNQVVWTVPAVQLGAASPNRKIVIQIAARSSSTSIQSVTLGGIAMTKIDNISNIGQSLLTQAETYYLNYPDNVVSADLVVTAGASVTRIGMTCYNVQADNVGPSSGGISTTGTTTTNISLAKDSFVTAIGYISQPASFATQMTTSAGGFFYAGNRSFSVDITSATTTAWTGINKDWDVRSVTSASGNNVVLACSFNNN